MSGTLYIVPTPIGNLEDITLRALRTLQEVDLIACEDTRVTARLLQHYHIHTPRTSYHEHNERKKTPWLIEQLKQGKNIALVSDAGTPGISDPGYPLIRACIEAEIPIEPLPGPTAFVPALVASGLPTHRFAFEGFLPAKKGRKKRLNALKEEERTLIFYESPHRLVKTLETFVTVFGPDRPAAVVRELTKKHEEIRRGTLSELYSYFAGKSRIRGEIVLIVGGIDAPSFPQRQEDT